MLFEIVAGRVLPAH